ncbi:homogentisate 1,2-dioxygenase [Pseudonocardia xishanensis]|uniref:Homogentisate 1,2-dioxygenase N-terminal domain-containing protein n=1 Tax=Pseudonocardia xishanensis TaxID=630995 RepID=A0ABP8RVM8_9PSEU
MSDIPTREVLTNGDRRTTIERTNPPTDGVISDAVLTVFDVFDDAISPANYDKADGAPLRVLASAAAKLDVSKRNVEDMGFWHRSIDHDEVIICVRGKLRWETEIGTRVLTPGQVLLIPRGVAHRSALTQDSEGDNVLIELKVAGDLEYVGPPEARLG